MKRADEFEFNCGKPSVMMSYVVKLSAGYQSQVIWVTQLRTNTPCCLLKNSCSSQTHIGFWILLWQR